MRLVTVAVAVLSFAGFRANAQGPPFADLVIIHGQVWTVDPPHPRAEAIAIHGGRIIAVGRRGNRKMDWAFNQKD